MALIELENIIKTYSLGEMDVNVLKGINLSIDKADLLVAYHGAAVSGRLTEFFAVKDILAAGRSVETAEDIHQGTFSGTGSTHQRHIIALVDR